MISLDTSLFNGHVSLPLPDQAVSVQAAFPGPHAENSEVLKTLIKEVVSQWIENKQKLFPQDARVKFDFNDIRYRESVKELEQIIKELGERLEGELPLASGRYVAHMLSERSIPGILGQVMGALYNANNVTSEASRVSIQIEGEAIGSLCHMIGYPQPASRGHFTAGGTIANYEAILRARYRMAKWQSAAAAENANGENSLGIFTGSHMGWEQYDQVMQRHRPEYVDGFSTLNRNPYETHELYGNLFRTSYKGPVILLPGSAHYSWEKGAVFNGLGKEALWKVDTDAQGRMSITSLRKKIELARKQNRPILMVVSVAGTTELGVLDPVDQIQDLLSEYAKQGIHIWHHSDAAWGGFMRSMLVPPPFDEMPDRFTAANPLSLDTRTYKALNSLSEVNSLTIDPHKLGYVPYSAGAFLVRYGREYYLDPAQAPYIQWDSTDRRPPQTLEGSRSSGGALGVWLTDKTIGLHSRGLGALVGSSLAAKNSFETLLKSLDKSVRIVSTADSSIICFCLAQEGESVSQVNLRTNAAFETLRNHVDDPLVVSKTSLDISSNRELAAGHVKTWEGSTDSSSISLIRLCLFNPHFTDTQFREDSFKRYADVLNTVIEKFKGKD